MLWVRKTKESASDPTEISENKTRLSLSRAIPLSFRKKATLFLLTQSLQLRQTCNPAQQCNRIQKTSQALWMPSLKQLREGYQGKLY
jgi:hypothetical protein